MRKLPRPMRLGEMLAFGQIAPNFCRGDQPYVDEDYLTLANRGVTLVITLRRAEGERTAARRYHPPYDPEREAQLCAAAGMKHMTFALEDFTPLGDDDIEAILDAIEDAHARGEHIFIHCLGGVGRTGYVVACWMMRSGWTVAEAVRSFRQFVDHYALSSLREGETLPAYYERIKANDHLRRIHDFAERESMKAKVSRVEPLLAANEPSA